MGDASVQFAQAELLRKGGQYHDAESLFHRPWSQEYSPGVGWRWASCLRQLGQDEEAVRVSTDVVPRHPDDVWAWRELAWDIYASEVKPAQADQNLGKVGTLVDSVLERSFVSAKQWESARAADVRPVRH